MEAPHAAALCPAERTRQRLLGDRDVSTTTIYTHADVFNRGPAGVRSPSDWMLLT
jgi:hypothetical protein